VLDSNLVASARLRYLGTSAQKARLVVDLIRGRGVGEAIATLRFTRKAVAREIGRLLDSAVANARQKRQDVDVDRLYVRTAFVDGGPSLKRIRPAPMGRAFRVQKRMCHVTLGLDERPEPGAAAPAPRGAAAEAGEGPPPSRGARPAAGRRRAGGARGGARKTKARARAGRARSKKRAAGRTKSRG
jgi:large subunit ribosomal protein L22